MSDQNNYLDEYAGQGFENIGANDIIIPFLKILQKGSHEVDENDPSYVKEAKAGTFMNSLTKEVYGSYVDFVPIKYDSMWLEWAPNRGGFKGRHAINSIPVTGNQFEGGLKAMNGNDIQETLVFMGLMADRIGDGPVILSLSATELKHGRNWNARNIITKLQSGKPAPYFGCVWRLQLTYNINDGGNWFMLGTKSSTTIQNLRYITPEELAYVLPTRKMLASAKVDYAAIADKSGDSEDCIPF